jgi:NIMA-interacting peptidyl-prolyl cis-trans isomerase 1
LVMDCRDAGRWSIQDPDGKQITQRTKEQAISQLLSLKGAIDAGTDWAGVAAKESDCGSAREGGDLGFFERGAMQKPFEDAAFALQVGEISGIVDTDSGVHIIKRLA